MKARREKRIAGQKKQRSSYKAIGLRKRGYNPTYKKNLRKKQQARNTIGAYRIQEGGRPKWKAVISINGKRVESRRTKSRVEALWEFCNMVMRREALNPDYKPDRHTARRINYTFKLIDRDFERMMKGKNESN